MLFFFTFSGNLYSQNLELKETEFNEDNQISFSKPASILTTNLVNEQSYLLSIIKSQKQLKPKLIKTTKIENRVHNFYQFLLQDIPIIGAGYAIHSSDGYIEFANGNIPFLSDTIDVNPSYKL
jgi:hypothetical protein